MTALPAAMSDTLASTNVAAFDATASEAALVRASIAGDDAAFAAIVRAHQQAVFGAAWHVLRDADEAEEIAQDTFVRAWKSLSRFDATRPLRPWLLRIAINAALDRRGKMRRVPIESFDAERSHAAHSVPDPGDDPAARAATHELSELLEATLSELPPESAALFHLRFREGQSVEEIGHVLRKSAGAVAVALHRLRERLASRLREHSIEVPRK